MFAGEYFIVEHKTFVDKDKEYLKYKEGVLRTHAPIIDYYPPIEKRKKEGENDPFEQTLGRYSHLSPSAPRFNVQVPPSKQEADVSLCASTYQNRAHFPRTSGADGDSNERDGNDEVRHSIS